MAALQAVCRLGGTRLRLVAVGGAVVPPSQLGFLRACFGAGGAGGGRAVVSDGYGMTEVPRVQGAAAPSTLGCSLSSAWGYSLAST